MTAPKLDLALAKDDLRRNTRQAMDRKLDVHLPAALAAVETLRARESELEAALHEVKIILLEAYNAGKITQGALRTVNLRIGKVGL